VLSLLTGCGTAIERGLIYHPSVRLDGTPADLALAYEDVQVRTEDGVTIHGWHVPGRRAATVLYAHGNAGNVSHRLPKMKRIHDDLGLSVLIFDYRGYGRSGGSPSESGTYADARAMRAWLRQRGADPVVYFGESLGSAVVVHLAADDPPAALLLEAPFASVRRMAHSVLPGAGYLFRTRYDSQALIGRVRAPLLVLHGDADEVVPFVQGRDVFEAAREPKTFVAVPGARHNDIALAGPVYWSALSAFLTTHLP
jgi:hypothetical protein